jgi:formylglycine-generating enzyme required for sulfatase activity
VDEAPNSGAGLGWWVFGVFVLLLLGGGTMVWRAEDQRLEAEAAAAAAERAAADKAAEEKRLSTYELKRVPAGTYTIGCTAGQASACESDETKRKVTLSRAILVGTTEVTQALWARTPGVREAPWAGHQLVDGKDYGPCEGVGVGAELPVMCVSWVEAAEFANALSKRDGLELCYEVQGEQVKWPRGTSCSGYRLPTEAEWEVAARGGADHRYAGGDDVCRAANVANAGRLVEYRKMGYKPDDWQTEACDDGAAGLARVGSYAANGYGLYDMSGNVWEWTWDWYASSPGAGTDPTGPASGLMIIHRALHRVDQRPTRPA